MSYQFNQQHLVGQKGERMLDRWLVRYYDILPATRRQEQRGIDRIARHKLTRVVLNFQYKADTYTTGNAVIETISVDDGVNQKPGWAVNCSADYLFYLLLESKLVYILQPSVIQSCLDQWKQQYTHTSVENEGYRTHGLLVPLREIGRVAKHVTYIEG